MDMVMDGRHMSPIRRLSESGRRWRVSVETWHDRDEYHGRLLFHEDPSAGSGARESATLLHGRSREDVLALAHDLPEEQLRRVLHSLA
ncbi:MAG TPA: hypothetical protein VFZ24_14365 [Longimicrobiales bacterium]